MYYEFAITVSANTAESSPVEQYLKLTHGLIHHIEIQFPIGCAGLAHCQLLSPNFGSLPTNPSGDFSSDGYTIPIDENLEFFAEPYIIKARLWNDDETYPHTITIRVGMFESKTALWIISLFKGLAKMLKLMGIKV